MPGPSFAMPGRDGDGFPRRPGALHSACARVLEVGCSRGYTETHLVATWCLGMFHEAAVACRDCGATDWERKLHAALDWESDPC